eukprot:4015952-Amphidinium_carterae.1
MTNLDAHPRAVPGGRPQSFDTVSEEGEPGFASASPLSTSCYMEVGQASSSWHSCSVCAAPCQRAIGTDSRKHEGETVRGRLKRGKRDSDPAPKGSATAPLTAVCFITDDAMVVGDGKACMHDIKTEHIPVEQGTFPNVLPITKGKFH